MRLQWCQVGNFRSKETLWGAGHHHHQRRAYCPTQQGSSPCRPPVCHHFIMYVGCISALTNRLGATPFLRWPSLFSKSRWSSPLLPISWPSLPSPSPPPPNAAPHPRPHRAAGQGGRESQWEGGRIEETKMEEEAHPLLRTVKTRRPPVSRTHFLQEKSSTLDLLDLIPLFTGKPDSAIIWPWWDEHQHHTHHSHHKRPCFHMLLSYWLVWINLLVLKKPVSSLVVPFSSFTTLT